MSLNKEYLNDMARFIVQRLPDNHGFVLLTFPFGDDPGSRCTYASNANREDVINTLKEFMLTVGAEEDWMKHL